MSKAHASNLERDYPNTVIICQFIYGDGYCGALGMVTGWRNCVLNNGDIGVQLLKHDLSKSTLKYSSTIYH